MRASTRPWRRAFTLIELLVVIAIIGLLISLLLPALAASRRSAKDTVGYGNLRSLSQIMASYVNDYREEFPNPFRPVWPAGDPTYQNMTWSRVHSESDPQQQWDFLTPPCEETHTEGFGGVWYSFLAEYRGGRRNDPEQLSPADPDLNLQYRNSESDSDVRNGRILMPTSFIYPPVFWSKAARFSTASFCRGDMTPEMIQTALLSSVRYPQAKVMLFQRADFTGRTPRIWYARDAGTHIALVDGSCQTIAMRDIYAAAARSGNEDLIARITCCPRPPDPPILFFYATQNGIQGRDLPR